MPFKSQAQAGYMHAHPEILGKKGLAEWDAATKGKHLPERKHMDHEMAASGLAHKGGAKKPPKPQPEVHVKKMHTGGYHVTKHHPEGHMTEHAAPDLAAVTAHMAEHMEPEGGEGKGDPDHDGD